MRKTNRQSIRGVTVLEVLIAVFVLLVGVTGVIALFPVGVRFSQMSADDVASAMTAQNALAAVRVQKDLLKRLDGYVTTSNENGDVLWWTGSGGVSKGVDGITGTVNTVYSAFGNPDELTHIQVFFNGTPSGCFNVRAANGSAAAEDNCALLLMTSGRAASKLYRLDTGSSYTNSELWSVGHETNFPEDGIKGGASGQGDGFRLIGARDKTHRWVTLPDRFYEDGPSSGYKLGQGSAEGYGYLAIINRVSGISRAYRVTILVYKGYDEDRPPEANQPAIGCYATILSADTLR
ncbi:MAG: hypothetical protein ABIF82_00910 [Planctomycetota bacterium]